MSIKYDPPLASKKEETNENRFSQKVGFGEKSGRITNTLGTGDNARNSLIYLTIKWAFISGCILTILVIINYWFFRQNEKVPDITNDISNVWEILIPVITLALGYAFGKAQK